MKAGHAWEKRDSLSVRPKFGSVETKDVMASDGESDDEEVEGAVADEQIEKIGFQGRKRW